MWKDIPGWENYYEINENGLVRNKLNGNFIIGDTNNVGYRRVNLQNINHDPHIQRFFVHRLVAQLFVDNPYNFPVVNHINGDKTDNRAINLEFTTQRYNNIHRMIYSMQGVDINPKIIQFNDGTEILFITKKEIQEYFHIPKQTVDKLLSYDIKTMNRFNIKNIFRYVSTYDKCLTTIENQEMTRNGFPVNE